MRKSQYLNVCHSYQNVQFKSKKIMAISKSAKLAIVKSEKNKVINDRRKRTMKESVKSVRTLVSKKDAVSAEKNLSAAFKALDKAAKVGVIKKGQASRKKSRLALAIAKLNK